jgi:beta-lactamase superfamily II metal-dependent hydrolase
MRLVWLVLLFLMSAWPASARPLQIYFIDVEGGSATLVVTPAGESLLIDAGFGRGSRDPDRIIAAARDAGIDRIDYLLVTHFHGDHIGGIPELVERFPVVTFVDYGDPRGTVYGPDRMTNRSYAVYEPARNMAGHVVPRVGGPLPLRGVETTVVSSGGTLLSAPLPGGGGESPGCAHLEDHPEDGTENFRSLGVLLRHGAFSFAALGDLSGKTLQRLFCPQNLVGQASVYLIAHHGDYDSNSPAVYEALRPRVAVMNNGVRKGGDPETFKTVFAQPGLDLWQLHASRRDRVINAPEDFIANVTDQDCEGFWVKLEADLDGSFTMINGRTGFTRRYAGESRDPAVLDTALTTR